MNAVAGLLIIAGALFSALAVLGVLRFPDVYTRAHALGISDTLGVFLVLAGLMLVHGPTLLSAKLFLLLLVLFIINPTVIHAVLEAAHNARIEPWTQKKQR